MSDLKELETENLKLKDGIYRIYNHLRKHHYSGAFDELEPLLDEIMKQVGMNNKAGATDKEK